MADAHKERVGDAIRERREELQLSQAQLAAKIPVTEKTLRRWEKAESFGHMDNLERLAEALSTTVDQLMAGAQTRKLSTPDLSPSTAEQLSSAESRLAALQTTLTRLEKKLDDVLARREVGGAVDEGKRIIKDATVGLEKSDDEASPPAASKDRSAGPRTRPRRAASK